METKCKFRDDALSGIGMVNSAAWQDSGRITMNTSLALSFFTCRMTMKELLAEKHPTAWVEFETGQLTEVYLTLLTC